LKRYVEQASFVSWRFALLCGCIFLALLGLISRVAYLQVINPGVLVREGDMRSLRVQKVQTARGMISDRAGRPLAVSVPVNAVWADPKEFTLQGGLTGDKRWPTPCPCRLTNCRPGLTPTLTAVSSIWHVR
jgi:cell division protein FtsI (penicillin-binding protein 3)